MRLGSLLLVSLSASGVLAGIFPCALSEESDSIYELEESQNISQPSCILPKSCDEINQGFVCQPNRSRNWGAHSPFFSVPSNRRIPLTLPKECKITFALVLSRHGARYPVKRSWRRYKELVAFIQETVQPKKLVGKYKFLKTYRFSLGSADLTVFGQQQMVNSGIKFFRQYSALALENDPFIRTASGERVVMSADNFTQGFHAAKSKLRRDKFPYRMLIIPEKVNKNNTLSHGICTAFEDKTDEYKRYPNEWLNEFMPPIARRVNQDLGLKLNNEELARLMDLCPFETMDHPMGTVSPFCYLFSVSEWKQYSHWYTVKKYYTFGPGHPLGPSQGIGWTNELIARLTREPVRDSTSANRTLDADPETFPLDRSLYADFSHDNDMVAIYFAMGLFDVVAPRYNPKGADPNTYESNTASPFASRMYVEKMNCNTKHHWGIPELVRVLINDRVVPLRGCGADKWGRCRLDRFVASLKFARSGGNWAKCWERK